MLELQCELGYVGVGARVACIYVAAKGLVRLLWCGQGGGR